MDVYLLRTSLLDEGSQHLSLEGRRIVRAIGNKLKMTDEPSFDRFVVSPEPAAVQTAELFADRNDYIGVVETHAVLAGNTPASVIVQMLHSKGSGGLTPPMQTSIVVVADEPLLATIGAFLVGRPTFPPAVPAQVSMVRDRKPEWLLRPGETARQLLLIA